MNDTETVQYLIAHNVHMTLATAAADGKPWVSPVFFVYDEQYNFYWVSNKTAQHSKNVRIRPEVGIVIFGPVPPDGDLDGVYIDANATELESEAEIANAIIALRQRPQHSKFTTKSIADVSGPAAWRIYKAVPKEVSKRADAVDKSSGQAITVRRRVKF